MKINKKTKNKKTIIDNEKTIIDETINKKKN